MIRLVRGLRRVQSWAELKLLVGAAAVMAVMPLLLRLPIPRLLSVLSRLNRWLAPRPVDEDLLYRCVEALGRYNCWAWRDNCVARNLAVYCFLQSAQAPLEVRFGVEMRVGPEGKPAPGRRHVWLLRDGQPVRETEPLERYLVMYRYPEPAAGAPSQPSPLRQ